jgi:hypothetical protein
VLYQSDAEMLFPSRVIPALRDLRGNDWKHFIDHVSNCPESDPDVLAFGLLMIRLNGCITCNSDSYRALRGCTQCAQHTVARFKGSDNDLIHRWQEARLEIVAYLEAGVMPQQEEVEEQ